MMPRLGATLAMILLAGCDDAESYTVREPPPNLQAEVAFATDTTAALVARVLREEGVFPAARVESVTGIGERAGGMVSRVAVRTGLAEGGVYAFTSPEARALWRLRRAPGSPDTAVAECGSLVVVSATPDTVVAMRARAILEHHFGPC